jgi:hypothetical protein
MTTQTQLAKIARRYTEQVVSGEIHACRWVKQAYQLQLVNRPEIQDSVCRLQILLCRRLNR